jgi:lipase maturation factor 1
VLELGLVWMLFLPRRWRIVCFLIVTPWEIGVILTANYTFLNYLVLSLGFLLLDDRFLRQCLLEAWEKYLPVEEESEKKVVERREGPISIIQVNVEQVQRNEIRQEGRFRWRWNVVKLSLTSVVLLGVFYATFAEMVWMFGEVPLPTTPVAALEPLRIANRYGLFGIMTRGRYEIEFQGSNDGNTWTAYPFRFKPQDVSKAPGIYAPYQPRFDWNLWFASLGQWQDYSIVPRTEIKLLENDRDVLGLFAGSPFSGQAPREVRAVLWQYWFTSMEGKKKNGLWWRREFVGLYAPALQREADGTIHAIEMPTAGPRE